MVFRSMQYQKFRIIFIRSTQSRKWRNNLDSVQSVDLHNSDSPLTTLKFGSDSALQKLVDPKDSASQISEVISESGLQNVVEPQATASNVITRVYDVNDPEVLTNLLEDSSVYSYFDIADSVYYVISDTILTVDPSIVNSLNVFI